MDYNRMDINLLTGDSGQRPRRSVLMALFDACTAYALAWNKVQELDKKAANRPPIPSGAGELFVMYQRAYDEMLEKQKLMIKALEEAHQDAAGANDFRYR